MAKVRSFILNENDFIGNSAVFLLRFFVNF